MIIDRRVIMAVIFFIGLIAFMFVFYTQFDDKIENDVYALATENVKAISFAYGERLNFEFSDRKMVADFSGDSFLRSRLEENLRLLVAGNIKYAFIVYPEKYDVYRYLVDGTQGADHSVFGERFYTEAKEWEYAYKTGEPQLITHDDSVMLGLTYIYPIKDVTGVAGFLVVDFATASVNNINKILQDVNKLAIFLFTLFFLIAVGIVYYDYRYASVKKLAMTDSLTSLNNRTLLKRVNINLDRYIVVLMDIDYFKKVNDNHGHDYGDFVLVELADRMRKAFTNKKDHLVRYGGEEFLILFNKERGESVILEEIAKLHSLVKSEPFSFAGKSLKITVSIGVNLSAGGVDELDDAIKFADLALYEAKNSGRDKVIVYQRK